MKLGLAWKAFWRILRDSAYAARVAGLDTEKKAAATPSIRERKAGRNDALNLLALLQREARLLDFLKENLDSYSDAQIGAAVRDIHRDAGAAVERLFDLKPVLDQQEGAPVTVPEGFSPNQYKLTGSVSGEAPFKGRLCHHGWKAARCELPEWHGEERTAMIVMPAEVQIG
ncbi:MAG: DUF2760 domain-containing protein [Spartobacteria bacterium]|nr:DUF2760 domain-containing protein [Spartobacteria bacterium]